MFNVGDYIVYGNSGVCKVEEIGKLNVSGIQNDHIYYTLNPVYSKGSKIFTPIDNDKVIMRPVITKEDANALIQNMKEIKTLWVNDEKRREEVYKGALRTCNCIDYVKIIKTLYERKQNRLNEGKKVSSSDERYLHAAEDSLYGELAIALDIPKTEVCDYIVTCIDGHAQDDE